MNRHTKRIVFRAAVSCAAALMVLATLLLLDSASREKKYREERESGNEAFMTAGTVTWQGERYVKTPDVSLALIIGVDRTENEGVSTSRYRSGGQADFLLLLGIDHTNKRICQLQIDRDTMTDVTILSVYGRETGTRVLQICLANSFGANRDDNAKYTLKAVRNLLDDVEIDGYIAVDFTAVPVLNDVLGGVTVTVPQDMTSVNPEWTEGKMITLQGAEAEDFVRKRQTLGEGTNEERMKRQAVYMRSLVDTMKRKLSQDSDFANDLLSAIKRCAVTSLSDQWLLEELHAARGYQVMPIDYLEGEYKIGDGFMEYYVQEGSAENWIMTHLYTKKK